MLTRNLKPISEVVGELISKVSAESDKLHFYLLLNRSKGDANTHFSF